MRITKLERAQVVELLRCAHDMKFRLVAFPFMSAGGRLGVSNRIHNLAAKATTAVGCDWWSNGCLEAAARVEEGTWPL